MPQTRYPHLALRGWAIASVLMVCSGCAAMNTFQTPAVLKPGKAMLSPGIVFGTRGPTKDAALPEGGLIPLGRGLQVNGRIGVLPHLEVGAQVIGLGAVGLDAKIGFQHRSLLLAGNAGFGIGGIESSGLTGYESRDVRTHFGGIFLGYKGAYVGAKVIDYNYRTPPEGKTDSGSKPISVSWRGCRYVGNGRAHPARAMTTGIPHCCGCQQALSSGLPERFSRP